MKFGKSEISKIRNFKIRKLENLEFPNLAKKRMKMKTNKFFVSALCLMSSSFLVSTKSLKDVVNWPLLDCMFWTLSPKLVISVLKWCTIETISECFALCKNINVCFNVLSNTGWFDVGNAAKEF